MYTFVRSRPYTRDSMLLWRDDLCSDFDHDVMWYHNDMFRCTRNTPPVAGPEAASLVTEKKNIRREAGKKRKKYYFLNVLSLLWLNRIHYDKCALYIFRFVFSTQQFEYSLLRFRQIRDTVR